ncbi:hypothetical protein PN497_08145 [Sphaerospermopsis kisseleviana CS-549]|uniref:Uncharacterized protein n=1 Tax=Sphaerospermopsis kisseleviana CS-549 TaxID=3021783 RepID=A0ABT4ZQK9_9CYAN|nr:hypothetical protein [Sphaerospermopsis kisseleviana]MDB9441330.1 hypothetical protein [Sphaerospermopsis kisseleviana CS-549]BAZ78947.1 hypothetical protein NIES73_01860 [Sphaerospermopsis kisseleviana NIES-73]
MTTEQHLQELTVKQERTQTQLDQLSSRVDEFVFHAQRLFNKMGEDVEITKARTDRLEALMLKMDRNYEAQQSQLQEFQRQTQEFQRQTQEFQRQTQEFQRTTGAALERIDRVLDYLLRQSGQN